MKFDKDAMRWQCLGTREAIENKRFNEDYANSPVIKTIKHGLELEDGIYEATASELITASVYFGYTIHSTARKVAGIIEKYSMLLSFDGISIEKPRTAKKRTYRFIQNDI